MAVSLCMIILSGKTLKKSSSHCRFMRFFFAGAAMCEVDKQGRILLPAVLREFACLEKEVVLVGVGSRIEIWNKATWTEKNVYDDMDEIAENMEGLGI